MVAVLEPYWSPNPARKLTPNSRYLFAVVSPSQSLDGKTAIDDLSVQTQLERQGWEITSIGAPTAEMTAAIGELARRLREIPNLPSPPIAFRVIGFWRGAASTLPETDGFFAYGPIMTWVQPDGPAQPEPAPKLKESGSRWLVAGVAGLALAGLLYWATKPRSIEAVMARESTSGRNPIRYVETIRYRDVNMHVHKTDDGFCVDFSGVLRAARWRPATTVSCENTKELAIEIAKNNVDMILARKAA